MQCIDKPTMNLRLHIGIVIFSFYSASINQLAYRGAVVEWLERLGYGAEGRWMVTGSNLR